MFCEQAGSYAALFSRSWRWLVSVQMTGMVLTCRNPGHRFEYGLNPVDTERSGFAVAWTANPYQEQSTSLTCSHGYGGRKLEFRVYFQPKISLSTVLPTGAEALIRWQSPSRGLLGPGAFLPIAEEIGLMQPLTVWMLNSALRLSAEWTKQWGDLDVSVNIPTKLLENPDFVDMVLSSEGLWKNENITLCLEVLEQYFVTDVENGFAKLKELRSKGIKISIDDFGTGYSSLSYFRDIPADELKIDRSFVYTLLEDEANANIVALITDLAHRFGLSVVAEGAEDPDTLTALKKLHCDKVQGYIIARPMPAPRFKDWLNRFRQLA